MTIQNGCLRLCRGPWSEENHIDIIQPEENGNPDAGGRAGAIEIDLAATLKFDDLTVKGGSIVAFNGESKLVAAMSFFQDFDQYFLTCSI
jgi:hypothetical protein